MRSSGDAGDDAAMPRACNARCSCGLMMEYHRFVNVVVQFLMLLIQSEAKVYCRRLDLT